MYYRPKGWETETLLSYDTRLPTYSEKKSFERGYEAGADAMLEALIEKGVRTDTFRTNSNPIYLTNPRQKGVYVFIPKEKTLGDVLIGVAKETNRRGK